MSSRHHESSALAAAARRSARRFVAAGALVAALLIALTVTLTWQLRSALLASLIARDAEVLAGVLQLRLAPAEADLVLASPAERENLLTDRLLEVASLRGVLGLRLYDESGHVLDAIPLAFVGHELRQLPADSAPFSEFLPAADLSGWLAGPASGTRSPVLRLALPLVLPTTATRVGTAEFLLDATGLATQRRALENRLWLQSSLLLLAALALVTAILRWTWVHLRRSARALAVEQERLARSNAELALAVKTSAIGAVTAHLLHDLKNPLAGLDAFVRSGAGDPSATPDREDWQSAASATRHMRALTAEIADVLRSLDAGEGIDLTSGEITEALRLRHTAEAGRRGVTLIFAGPDSALVDGRQAQLILLILSQLTRNALEATPAGGRVEVSLAPRRDQLLWRLADTGPGLPAAIRERLFQPCRSSKADGSGLGLAIAARIAAHLGATLALETSTAAGTTFTLALPVPVSSRPLPHP